MNRGSVFVGYTCVPICHVIAGKAKVLTLAIALCIIQTRDQQRFTITEVAADQCIK